MGIQDHLASAKESFEKTVQSRWDHPIAGPFLFSWVIWNYEFLMIIFSGEPYRVKMYDLQSVYTEGVLLTKFIYALGSSGLYILAAPFSGPLEDLASLLAIWTRNYVNGLLPGKTYKQTDIDLVAQDHKFAQLSMRRDLDEERQRDKLQRHVELGEVKAAKDNEAAFRNVAENALRDKWNTLGAATWQPHPPKAFRLIQTNAPLQLEGIQRLMGVGLDHTQLLLLRKFKGGGIFSDQIRFDISYDGAVLTQEEIGELFVLGLLTTKWSGGVGLDLAVTDAARVVLSEYEELNEPAATLLRRPGDNLMAD